MKIFSIFYYFLLAYVSFVAAEMPFYRSWHWQPKLAGTTYQTIGTVDWTYDDMKSKLHEFALLYENRPIKDNFGGMNSAHMFYVWFLVKKLKPKYIIESGIWKGQSTWLLEQAAPDATIISIDPNLQFREYISKNVFYHTKDFSALNWSALDKESTLCFFDDHQGTIRIKQAQAFGFKHILYEDNFPHYGGNFTDGLSPKAAFAQNQQEAEYLRSVLDIYYEFPPIVPNYGPDGYKYGFNWPMYKAVTPPPLFLGVDDPALAVYAQEAYGYYWLAYLRIK